jgi:hypothetical protein
VTATAKGYPTPYGFKWGPALVERRMEFEGRVCIGVITETGRRVDVYVSRTGRSVRVFENGQELTATPSPSPERKTEQ